LYSIEVGGVLDDIGSWQQRVKRKWLGVEFFEVTEVRNPQTLKWEVFEMTQLVEDPAQKWQWVPVGTTLADIAAREAEAIEERRRIEESHAFKAAKEHQARIDKGIAAMSDVEYAMFSQLDDIKVLLGGVRSDTKFAESIREAPQFGMGVSLIDDINPSSLGNDVR
jgi:hypothetical protein